jgi:hypothetical protein
VNHTLKRFVAFSVNSICFPSCVPVDEVEIFSISGKVILAAHQCGYHVKLLLELLQKFNIPYEDTIEGFCDSLTASR